MEYAYMINDMENIGKAVKSPSVSEGAGAVVD
jgi:hypothetical protein